LKIPSFLLFRLRRNRRKEEKGYFGDTPNPGRGDPCTPLGRGYALNLRFIPSGRKPSIIAKSVLPDGMNLAQQLSSEVLRAFPDTPPSTHASSFLEA